MAADYPFEQFHGITFPGLFAMMATAHMHQYGTTEEHLGKIASKNHHHGTLNPKAHMQREVPLETVMTSKYVAWPLKLYDCSLISDGASCIILTKPELASKYTDQPVHIIGSGQATDAIGLYERDSLTSLNPPNSQLKPPTKWQVSPQTKLTSPKYMIASQLQNSSHTKTSASAQWVKAVN
jgi:acetyl-CoA C-acetyltransferase